MRHSFQSKIHSQNVNTKVKLTWFCLILICANFKLNAQEVKLTKEKSFIALPVAFYLPETKLGFGGVARCSFKWQQQIVSEKVSSISAGLVYTLNKQLLIYFPYNLYFKEDKIWIKGEFGYYDYIYPYQGIGIENRTALESYSVKFPRIETDYLHKYKKDLYLGINFRLDAFNGLGFDEEGALKFEDVLGKEGGLTLGIGPLLILDKRDHINFPTKGSLLEMRYFFNAKALGSDYDFTFFEFSTSKYIPIKNNVLALNAYTKIVYGEAPFYELALFGGGKQSRGYLRGSYRDDAAFGLQMEYRIVLKKNFGAVVFANIGGIHSHEKGFDPNEALPAIGAGLRYALDKKQKVNLRIDFGYGKDGLQFYFTFGEAF